MLTGLKDDLCSHIHGSIHGIKDELKEHTADNTAINSAYRRKALECHPDKEQGSREKWLQLQVSLQVIKCSRRDKF